MAWLNQAGGVTRATSFGNERSMAAAPEISFYRNRYYDQRTGRWTQEDPLGLAGGANLYSYAGNNPVAYTDPFGLCKPWPDCWFQGFANWGSTRRGTVGWLALNGGAALNATSEAFGTNDLGAAIGEGDIAAGAFALATMLPVGKLGKAARLESHHLFPQAREFAKFFANAGIDIHKFTVTMTEAAHRLLPDGLHTVGGGHWNRVWTEFMKENPLASADQIWDQLEKMLRDFGIM